MPDRTAAMPLWPPNRAAGVRDRCGPFLPILRPRRHRPRHGHTVHPDLVDLLVEKGQEAPDLGAFGDRLGVAPDDVGIRLTADPRRPVAGAALIRAGRRLF